MTRITKVHWAIYIQNIVTQKMDMVDWYIHDTADMSIYNDDEWTTKQELGALMQLGYEIWYITSTADDYILRWFTKFIPWNHQKHNPKVHSGTPQKWSDRHKNTNNFRGAYSAPIPPNRLNFARSRLWVCSSYYNFYWHPHFQIASYGPVQEYT